jgi:GMP synthase-like glutamine amidotransferase
MSARRIGFVISERAGGLTPERMREFERARERLAVAAGAEVETVHYAELESLDADVVVLSGSFDPWAAHDPEALDRLDEALRVREGPLLGICAGMQTLVRAAGGEIGAAERPVEAGFGAVDVLDGTDLLQGVDLRPVVFQKHSDEVRVLPEGLRVLASSTDCAVEAVAAPDRPWWGTQFHPEAWTAEHPAGRRILENFFRLAGIV